MLFLLLVLVLVLMLVLVLVLVLLLTNELDPLFCLFPQVRVTRAPTADLARRLGKAVVNSPLFKAAIAGNDPNVGRLLAVVGRVMGTDSPETDVTKTK